MQLFNLPIDHFVELEDKVLVSGCSLIFDEKFTAAYYYKKIKLNQEFLDEEMAQRIKRIGQIENGRLDLDFTSTPKIIAYIFEKATPFNLMHSNNWFHFLIESLPSFLQSIVEGKIDKQTIIVSGKLHINMQQVLSCLFDTQLNIFQIDPMRAIYTKSISYVKSSFICHELQSGVINSDYYFNNENILLLKNILEKKLIFNNNFIKGRKLFVVRQSFQRNVINISELITLAKNNGFQIIFPERLTFTQQVEVFSSAERIVGPTGAWLANLLFVNSNARVTVLNPNTAKSPASIWKVLSTIIGTQVDDYYFEVIEKNEYQPIHSDFNVDCKFFEYLLND